LGDDAAGEHGGLEHAGARFDAVGFVDGGVKVAVDQAAAFEGKGVSEAGGLLGKHALHALAECIEAGGSGHFGGHGAGEFRIEEGDLGEKGSAGDGAFGFRLGVD